MDTPTLRHIEQKLIGLQDSLKAVLLQDPEGTEVRDDLRKLVNMLRVERIRAEERDHDLTAPTILVVQQAPHLVLAN